MPTILANDLTVHYQQAGNGQDIVLVHGVTGDLSIWYARVMPLLAGHYRLTAYDLRGHGYTQVTPTGYTTRSLADDLRALLDALGIESAHLVGHSIGAAVALHCALLFPDRVRSLVLADPGIPALMSLVDLDRWPYLEGAGAMAQSLGVQIPSGRWTDLSYVVRQWLDAGSPAPFGLGENRQRSNRRLRRLLEETFALTEVMEEAGLTLEALRRVRQPTLAIYGEASRFLQTATYLEENLSDCRVRVVEGAAHFFALAKPEVLASDTLDFLRGLDARAAAGEPEASIAEGSPGNSPDNQLALTTPFGIDSHRACPGDHGRNRE